VDFLFPRQFKERLKQRSSGREHEIILRVSELYTEQFSRSMIRIDKTELASIVLFRSIPRLLTFILVFSLDNSHTFLTLQIDAFSASIEHVTPKFVHVTDVDNDMTTIKVYIIDGNLGGHFQLNSRNYQLSENSFRIGLQVGCVYSTPSIKREAS